MSTILLVLLVILLLGGVGPWWGWHTHGYYPMGGALGVIVVILIVLALTGRL